MRDEIIMNGLLVPGPRKLTFFSPFAFANYDALRNQTVIKRRSLDRDRRSRAVAAHTKAWVIICFSMYM